MSRGRDRYGRFRGLKVRADRYSGEVNLRIPYRDLRELLAAASLNCYDSLDRLKEAPHSGDDVGDTETYNKGLLAFIRGIESIMDEAISYRPSLPPPTVAQRRAIVEAERRERKFLDDLIDSYRKPA